jgi:hypothetical protein
MGNIYKQRNMHEKAMFHFGIALDLKPPATEAAIKVIDLLHSYLITCKIGYIYIFDKLPVKLDIIIEMHLQFLEFCKFPHKKKIISF